MGINFSYLHAHGPSPVDGFQDLLSADFTEAVANHTFGIFEVDGVLMNFMGGMMCQSETNHDGKPDQLGYDAIVVRHN